MNLQLKWSLDIWIQSKACLYSVTPHTTNIMVLPGTHILFFFIWNRSLKCYGWVLAVMTTFGESLHVLIHHKWLRSIVCVVDGSLLSWWVGGPGEGQVQTYWGGAPPGTQQCACGLQKNCVDPKHRCNCDADRTEWYCSLIIIKTEDEACRNKNSALVVSQINEYGYCW